MANNDNHQHLEDLKERARELPLEPGVYLYKDSGGRVLYVGKAKQLRKRVLSYFTSPARQTPKTRAMLSLARSIDILTTATEKEALLLEASLIKKHRPRYNIVLRDDKQYILFRLDKKSEFPRLTLTRKVKRDGAMYFGPFTSALAAPGHMEGHTPRVPSAPLYRQDIGEQGAPLPVSPYQSSAGRPACSRSPGMSTLRWCEGWSCCSQAAPPRLTRLLREEMLRASEALEFEQAAALRDQLKAVEKTVEQQVAVLPDGGDMDVLGLAPYSGEGEGEEERGGLALGVLFVRKGRLLDRRCFFWPGLSPGGRCRGSGRIRGAVLRSGALHTGAGDPALGAGPGGGVF